MDILNHPDVERLIRLALDEDGVQNDITTAAAGLDGAGGARKIRATIVARKETVACGFPLVSRILDAAGMRETIAGSALAADGGTLRPNSPWVIFEGKASDLLRVERTILNFLMRMAGIAHQTRLVVNALEGTKCRLLHTRKTAPGHRRTDIYAALTGGAHPHRRSLDQAILVKENHLRAAASFQAVADGIGKLRGHAEFVEIEVTDFTELKHALAAKPDRILLDNFAVENVARAVNLFGGSVELEASGGITPATARAFAETGVDFISMGSITHSAPAANLSLLFDYDDRRV